MGHSGIVGSRREPLVFVAERSQAEILATRREKRSGIRANLERRTAAARYAIERLSNEGGSNLNVNIRKLHPDATIPQYATVGAAAFDLVAVEDVIITPGETKRIPLGLAFGVPAGYVLYVMMRSGTALKTKLRQPNGVGVIDSDYRGEVSMLFENTGESVEVSTLCYTLVDEVTVRSDDFYPVNTYLIRKGDRIAQGVIQAVPTVTFTEAAELSETARGAGGFGHTGTSTYEYVCPKCERTEFSCACPPKGYK